MREMCTGSGRGKISGGWSIAVRAVRSEARERGRGGER